MNKLREQNIKFIYIKATDFSYDSEGKTQTENFINTVGAYIWQQLNKAELEDLIIQWKPVNSVHKRLPYLVIKKAIEIYRFYCFFYVRKV